MNTNAENLHEEFLSSRLLVHFLQGGNLCQISVLIFEVSSLVVLYFAYPLISFNLPLLWFQAAEWVDDTVQQEEGEVQKGRILLEEEERWEDHARRSHEAESAGSWGEWGKLNVKGEDGGKSWGESQRSFWHRQTKAYTDFSPGCIGDSRMVQ